MFWVFPRPILEEQALLKEKLKSQLTWKKDKDTNSLRRKAQPMVRTLCRFLSVVKYYFVCIAI